MKNKEKVTKLFHFNGKLEFKNEFEGEFKFDGPILRNGTDVKGMYVINSELKTGVWEHMTEHHRWTIMGVTLCSKLITKEMTQTLMEYLEKDKLVWVK